MFSFNPQGEARWDDPAAVEESNSQALVEYGYQNALLAQSTTDANGAAAADQSAPTEVYGKKASASVHKCERIGESRCPGSGMNGMNRRRRMCATNVRPDDYAQLTTTEGILCPIKRKQKKNDRDDHHTPVSDIISRQGGR